MKNRLSENVGGVKYFLSTLRRALRKESHFALVEGLAFAFPTVGSLVIVSGQHSVRPMHVFGHNRDPDYQFRLPWLGERDAQSITRCFTAHHGDVRDVPRANRTL